MNHKSRILALSTAALVGACGGGSNDNAAPPPTTAVPANASSSIDGYVGYLQSLVVAAADMLEPVDVGAVTPPTSETAEPSVIN